MSWCWKCGREDPERCPYFDVIADCPYGAGCYLEELEEEFGISFDDENFETLNGFMISKLEHIPADDEMFEIDYCGYHFKALEIENRMFKTISVIRNISEEESDAEEEAETIKFVEENDK